MTRRSVQDYVAALRPHYLVASRGQKRAILHEVCRVTGYHRKAVIRLLRGRRRRTGARRGRPAIYGPPVAHALHQLWEASDYLCSRRLAPFLGELIDVLQRHHALNLAPQLRRALLTVSPSTIDRLLHPLRPKGLRRPHGGRPPTTAALRAQVPIRTFGEWRNVRPGSLQADLVLHCGQDLKGFFLTSLVTVDVATGWTECRPVWGQGIGRVGTAIHLVRQHLPFALRELHTDNGSEFLNNRLLPWSRREGIRLTRGRPWKKNDQAYAEQKVWTAVRRLVGYDRFTSRAAYEQLARVYELLGLYLNFFQPVRKLIAKRRVGARVRKRYDLAQTPHQRVRASGILDLTQREALGALYATLNPIDLRRDLDAALRRLWTLADRSTR